MIYANLFVSITLLVLMTLSPIQAQEAEEAEEDTTEAEEAEEVEEGEETAGEEGEEGEMEEVAEEEMEEEMELESGVGGFTVGLNIGYPVYTGQYMKDMDKGPNIGVIVGTPYGFPLGPFNIGAGAEIVNYTFSGYKGNAFFATINTSIYNIAGVDLAVQVGGGYFGGGVGTTVGGSIDYAMPNLPLTVRGYTRANVTSNVGNKSDDLNPNQDSGWISVGVMLAYDISTLF